MFLRCLFLVLLVCLPTVAQQPASDSSLPTFLVGTWKGSGWMEMGPQRRTFDSTETVRMKFGGKAMVVEGLHTAKDPAGTVVHDAMAFIMTDPATKQLRFSSYLADGRRAEAEARMIDAGTFEWMLKNTPGGTIRYTIKLDDKGQWLEIGEMSRDGATWRKFFEMTLRKEK